MNPRSRCRALALGALWLAATPGSAATAATHPCAAVPEDAQRLACYDAAFPRPAQAPAAAPATKGESPATAPASAAVAATAAVPSAAAQAAAPAAAPASADFGLSQYAKRSLDPDPAGREPSRITAVVAAVARGRDGRFVVTLDNGQVWRQIETLSQARVSVGDTITIREASLGSFLLVTSNRIATRVRRVR